MPRPYRLGRRAEQQAGTRRRIVEAAVALHGSVGPALTTVSMVAERAGVQRHTVYAHFPNEMSLYQACSASALERDPMPDPAPWRKIADRRTRLETGLRAVYGWYARNADLAACVLRDAEHHAPTREIVGQRLEPLMQRYREVLGKALGARQRAVLRLALNFFTWRTLVHECGLKPGAAAKAMVQAIDCGRAQG